MAHKMNFKKRIHTACLNMENLTREQSTAPAQSTVDDPHNLAIGDKGHLTVNPRVQALASGKAQVKQPRDDICI